MSMINLRSMAVSMMAFSEEAAFSPMFPFLCLTTCRLEICRDRRDRRSCKIFPNCVKFWGNNANSLGNYRVTYALNE